MPISVPKQCQECSYVYDCYDNEVYLIPPCQGWEDEDYES